MIRLFLLRHAKAEQGIAGDHERALTERGQGDAAKIGRALAARGLLPDLVVCSTSKRTRETLDFALPFLPQAPECVFERGLYHAEPDEIMAYAAALAGPARTVMAIGHNPGMADLAYSLAGDGGMAERIAHKFPTCAFAAFEAESSWAASPTAAWRATELIYPSDL